mgnify:CR=1 FL=1
MNKHKRMAIEDIIFAIGFIGFGLAVEGGGSFVLLAIGICLLALRLIHFRIGTLEDDDTP